MARTTIEWEGDPPDMMVDLGGGMVVPLAELVDTPPPTGTAERPNRTP